MSDNSMDNALSGLGDYSEVCNAHANRPDNESTVRAAIDAIHVSLDLILESAGGDQVANAIACSIINRQFERTNWILRTTDNGRVAHDLVSDKSMRAIVIKALGIDQAVM